MGRVIAMVLLHDLVEIDAGDLSVYADEAQQARQEEAERAAADRIFALLPPAQAAAFRALWDEFEERATHGGEVRRAPGPAAADAGEHGGRRRHVAVAHGITATRCWPGSR